MSWIEIPQELYADIYVELEDRLHVFGTCTHLKNCSAYDAKMLSEWGFEGASEPLIRSIHEPESQIDIPENWRDWEHRYYIYRSERE